jgi:hypothetical protein
LSSVTQILPAHLHLRRTLPIGPQRNFVPKMAACVESTMQDLALDAVDACAAAETAKAVVPEQPGTPDAAQTASEEPNGTADKAKKQRRRRGKKPAAAADKEADENAAPAGPVDVAAVLKARAAAKKGGRKGKPASAAAQAALANAKARPQKKSGAKGGRSEGGPRAAKTGKSQNDKCLP